VTVLLGYFLGGSWELVERRLGRTSLVVVAVIVTIVWLRRRSSRSSSGSL
jgi:membrane protein DedA with SNARE-associated domain